MPYRSAVMTTSRSVAFYPACFRDIAAARLLERYANQIVLCDANPALIAFWQSAIERRHRSGPWIFTCGDARAVVGDLEGIDVAFQRRDSWDGSCLSVVRRPLLPSILAKMPTAGGLFITDGSNCWPNEFRRMTRPRGVRRHGWHLYPAETQPLVDREGVWLINAMP